MKETDWTWALYKSLPRESEIARVGVESQQQAGLPQPLRQRAGVAAAAQCAVHDYLPRTRVQQIERFLEQDRIMSAFRKRAGIGKRPGKAIRWIHAGFIPEPPQTKEDYRRGAEAQRSGGIPRVPNH